jgi:catechol 2,3-dioxygenase-like lactoylglutathione lyase family enzyme
LFSHVFVGSNDIDASKKFYDAALGAIGIPEGKVDPRGRLFYPTKTGMFGLTKPIDGKAATHANGGKSIEDPPGWREGAAGKLYLAYMRDPAGNKLCAMCRG